MLNVHRFAYELLVGPIPHGFQVDHLCRNHSCVNPHHLEVVTQRDNILRGQGVTAHNARAISCPQGHLYDIFNTRIVKANGKRKCRACSRIASKRFQWLRRHS